MRACSRSSASLRSSRVDLVWDEERGRVTTIRARPRESRSKNPPRRLDDIVLEVIPIVGVVLVFEEDLEPMKVTW